MNPDGAYPGPQGGRPRHRRARVPRVERQAIRHGRLRAARFGRPGGRAVRRAPRELPVHEGGVRAGEGPPRPRRRVHARELLPRALRGRPTGGHDRRGLRDRALPDDPRRRGASRIADREHRPDRRRLPDGHMGPDRPCPRGLDRRPPVPLCRATASIPDFYLLAIGLILLVSIGAVQLASGSVRRMRPYIDLFFMGAGFLLLETRNIVTFSLLFGTTWLVNALVFAGILVAVLAAIEVADRFRPRRPELWYIALLASLAVAWLVPASWLLHCRGRCDWRSRSSSRSCRCSSRTSSSRSGSATWRRRRRRSAPTSWGRCWAASSSTSRSSRATHRCCSWRRSCTGWRSCSGGPSW